MHEISKYFLLTENQEQCLYFPDSTSIGRRRFAELAVVCPQISRSSTTHAKHIKRVTEAAEAHSSRRVGAMRVTEYYFYHGDREHTTPLPQSPKVAVGILPSVRSPRPQDRVTSNVRNHSWWVSTQLRPQIQGQPAGQGQFAQPCEIRHRMSAAHLRPFVTGEQSTMTGMLSPEFYDRPPWSARTSRTEMYTNRNGWSTRDLHNLRHFSQHNLTSRLVPPPSGSIAGRSYPHSRPKHVHRYVEKLGAVWSPRQGTGSAATARQVNSDMAAFESRLAQKR